MERQRTCENARAQGSSGKRGIPRVLPHGTPGEKCDYRRLRNQLSFVSTAPLVHAKRHASLIRSWHNDCASRVAGSSSVFCDLQPPAFFRVVQHFLRSFLSRMNVRRISQIANETLSSQVFSIRFTVRFHDTGYSSRSSTSTEASINLR